MTTISEKTKTIVLDDTETLFENEVKLSDVISSSLEDYNPKVGDKVEEIEKELNWSIDKKITDPITGEETVEKIIDEEVKKGNKQMPLYKMVREFEIRETEFEKTTTKKIKRNLAVKN